MDTLISKERLIQVLRHTQEEKDCDAITVDALVDYLENKCPTAFDQEKVVEALKSTNCVDTNGYIAPEVAIEIVKKGGVE